MMKKGTFFYIAFLLLFSGCADDVADSPGDTPVNQDGSIAFLADSILTRGIPRKDLAAYDFVYLLAYSHDGNYADGKSSLYRQTLLNKSDGGTPSGWDYSPRMFWPEGRRLSFLAYASDMTYATASGSEGVFIRGDASMGAPTVEYIVPKDVKKQPDLLVATLLDHPKVSNVILPMKHALACVSFCATGPDDMRVKNIRLKNIYTKGTLSLDDASLTWLLDPKEKGTTIPEPGIDPDKPLSENPEGNYLMTPDGFLMMIPQTLAGATIDVVYWKGTAASETTNTYSLPENIVWKPGKKYIYKFGEPGEEVVVYYEEYADGSYGFQSQKTGLSPLDDAKAIVKAGYGVLSKSRLVSKAPTITLKGGNPVATAKIVGVVEGYNLYAVNQTATPGNTFVLPPTPAPVDVYFDGNDLACGKIIPHFAKGVSEWNPSEYAIRTPQQMLNISAITTTSTNANPVDNPSFNKVFKQERSLNFSAANSTIGGGKLTNAVVDQVFAGTYNSDPSRSIYNLVIEAPALDDIGIFSVANGPINDVIVKSTSITGKNNVGVIAGQNYWGGNIKNTRIIGTNPTTESINVTGAENVGGLVGVNKNNITGNDKIDPATGLTYAEVSGWVNITGSGSRVGGIAGHNALRGIDRVLVYGVYSNSSAPGDVTPALVKIRGLKYVGGITGVNDVEINGNVTGTGTNIKNLPDVGGVVDIEGGDWVGGIAGHNNGTLKSVNIRLGRSNGTRIAAVAGNGATGSNVGGIVGENAGTLGVESANTFISIRGNIQLTGVNNVGGIVGRNQKSGKLENCFVYDFFTQTGALAYFAPKITCSGSNAGGIVGENFAGITNCSVFSSSSASISVSSNKNAGGLVGSNKTGSDVTNCSMLGAIEVKATQSAGGVCGDNEAGTIISKCWIGSSDGYGIIGNAVKNLGLVTTPSGVNPAYEIPLITGDIYIGGIVGLNNGGVIDAIELKDNVVIGRANVSAGDGSNWVGGIVGGNGASYQGTTNVVRNCIVEQPDGKKITIQGASSLGGITGLNNGVVEGCTVRGISKLTIQGMGKIGGIVGQIGGHENINLGMVQFGNDYTVVRNCNVFGNVSLDGDLRGYETSVEVGGIAGLVGPIKDNIDNIINCKVGDASGKVLIGAFNFAGGIAGNNQGNISSCEVRNVEVTVIGSNAGTLAGSTNVSATTFSPPKGYRSDINGCKVYSGTISAQYNKGALLGFINSTEAVRIGSKAANQINTTGVTVNGAPADAGNILGSWTGGATLNFIFKGL